MQTETAIKEELERHIAHRHIIWNDPEKQTDRKIEDWIISTLEWVLRGGELKND